MVTGGAGFLGKYVVKNLIERGVKKENIFIPFFGDCDLRKKEDCQRVVEGQDIILHLAGVVGGIGFTRTHPGQSFYDNASMSLHMLEAARIKGVEKFVGIGSVCEYPKYAPIPFQEKDLWRGYPEETNGPYGMAKNLCWCSLKPIIKNTA